MSGIGLRGIGLIKAAMKGAPLGLSPFDFNPNLVSFTPGMAKRVTSVFAASPIVQGKRDGSTVGDLLTFSKGTSIVNNFYPTLDDNQGSIVFRLIPEWNSNSGVIHWLYQSAGIGVADWGDNYFYIFYGATLIGLVLHGGLVAGTAYNIVLSWDKKNTIDGTNYIRFSVNDTHYFLTPTSISAFVDFGDSLVGNGYYMALRANAIIEGLTVYRRVLYDGTYGVDVGNGDEVNLISAGIDPTTVTGSWDVVFCLPTNATAGALTTGTGNAWSHPHSSNLLTRGFLNDRYYGGGQWGVKLVGAGDIDCGSGATLDDLGAGGAIFQAEGWFRLDNTSLWPSLIFKANTTNALNGWRLFTNSTGILSATVDLATTDVNYTSTATVQIGKWHHILLHYNDTTKVAQIALDGVWVTASSAGVGAYQTDAAQNFHIGRGDSRLAGSVGWVRIHNHAHYTPGTNFVPPRAFPGADANTVEAWALNEGTGVTATATVTVPGNNGTITNGTWEPQWYDEGSPVRLQSVVGGASYQANVGSDAAIDDLADGAFTVDGWVRLKAVGGTDRYIWGKGGPGGTRGWGILLTNAGTMWAGVDCATTDASASYTWPDNYWHYLKMTFDDAGDRKVRLYVDDVLVSTSNAGVGAVVSDAGDNGFIKGFTANDAHGWCRWSNVVRGAGMIERSNPPAVDGNTVGQWNCTEGAGSTLDNAEGTATRDGVMSGTYTWNNSPAMESDSPGARNYAWGYVFGNDGADEGFKQTWSGLTVGKDYVIRGLAYSEDGVGQPEMIVYDETNAAILKTMTGTVTSTEKHPDLLMCSFELPTAARGAAADCTSISVKIINTVATGVVGLQQVELLANLFDNPSFDTGAVADPWIPDGWVNSGTPIGGSAQESVDVHSGQNALHFAGGGYVASIVQILATLNAKFYSIGCWGKLIGGDLRLTLDWLGLAQQYALPDGYHGHLSNLSWSHFTPGVARGIGGGSTLDAQTSWGGHGLLDDFYAVALDDVSLTVTPASAANSAESGGIRVDGVDQCNQAIPAGRLFATAGWIRWRYIPRHNDADMVKFGVPTACVGFFLGAYWSDYILLRWTVANTLQLQYQAGGAGINTSTWNTGGGVILAGNNYLFELRYTPTQLELLVDGISRITIVAPTNFGVILGTFYQFYPGGWDQHDDAVFLAP